jgi:hypothetical protein
MPCVLGKEILKIPSVPSHAVEPNLFQAPLCCSSVGCVYPNTLLYCLFWFTSLNVIWHKVCCVIGKRNCTCLPAFLLAVHSDHWETCIYSPLILLIFVVLIMMTLPLEAQNQCVVTTWECCHSTSSGSSNVHADILSYLPLISRDFQLSIYNYMWIETKVSSSWREVTIILILKPSRGHPSHVVSDQTYQCH